MNLLQKETINMHSEIPTLEMRQVILLEKVSILKLAINMPKFKKMMVIERTIERSLIVRLGYPI